MLHESECKGGFYPIAADTTELGIGALVYNSPPIGWSDSV
jgi:hypothetical protein